MNRPDFDKLMQSQAERNGGKRLLLHCCCAPCSSACLERLKDDFKITILFYNPNIEDEEYERRKSELLRLINETGWADFIDCDHDEDEFYSAVEGLETEREGSSRCLKCFELRLKKTKEIADTNGYDFFTTTLTVSPLKNAQAINEIGERLGGEKWLYSDFKKRNGYLRSIELSKKHGLYRQNYCGCRFSKRETELK
ncbi:MAG: epoxyqueuosine reductase QueH [Clostridia bacterium]|nr:epoxyqueuosine reductase QueH [Clostridia bacterium]